MKLNRNALDEAAGAGIISDIQAGQLWDFLAARGQDQAGFQFTHILYYLGGLLAIGAMSLFMTIGWESFGGWGIFGIATAYAFGGLLLTEFLLRRKQLRVPAGITATFVVVLVPLAVYGLQRGLGFWPDGSTSYREFHEFIDWRWIVMELATLACGTILLHRYRLPFMLMPIAVVLWYMSMDLTPFLFGDSNASWDKRKIVSIVVGLVTLALALVVDVRTRRNPDFAFWLYLSGVLAFWGGLSSMYSDDELGKFLYMLINLGMIVVGAALVRRVFVVFGGLGVAGYLGYLAYNVFRNSLMFPFALTLLGFLVIGLGIAWQRNEAVLSATFRKLLPAPLQEMVDNAG